MFSKKRFQVTKTEFFIQTLNMCTQVETQVLQKCSTAEISQQMELSVYKVICQ